MPKHAPRSLETRVKLGLKRLRDCLDRCQRAYFYEDADGCLQATSIDYKATQGKLIGCYTTVDWQQIVEDIEAA